MDRYKKKSLKFSGYGREIRTAAINSNRAVAREKRFSILRSLEESLPIQDEETLHVCKIPTVGQTQGSRLEMLRKWKQEKIMKQQQVQKLKKPAFKVGVIKPTPLPAFVGQKFAFDKMSSRLGKSGMQVSHVDRGTVAASQTKLKLKELSLPSTSKMQFMPKDTSRTGLLKIPNKESHLQAISSKPQSKVTLKPKDTIKTGPLKVPNKGSSLQGSSNKAQTVTTLKPENMTRSGLPKVPNKESSLQASSNKARSVATLKPEDMAKTGLLKVPNKISSGLPKPTIPNKKPMQMAQGTIPKINVPGIKHPAPRMMDKKCTIPKLPDTKYRHKPLFGRSKIDNNTTTASVISSRSQDNITIRSSKKEEHLDTNLIKENGMSTKENCHESMKSSESEEEVKENSVKENSITLEQDSEKEIFPCNLSYILPAQEMRKSFAPKDFVFHPPAELNASLFTDDGAWSIFSKIKEEIGRTSTPKEKGGASLTSSDVINDLAEEESEPQNVKQDEEPEPEGFEHKEAAAATPESELENFDHVRRSLRLANFPSVRQSERPGLASITEAPETTPRSERKKASLHKGFTPRRSMRLATLGQAEDLREVRRPTLFDTPEEGEDEVFKNISTNITYDFDRLHLESIVSEKEDCAIRNNRGKISLLYTPLKRGKASTSKKISITGDLISFSPAS